MKVRILNKIWNLLFVPPGSLKERKRANGISTTEENLGDCDDPNSKNKTIRVANNLLPRQELEIVIHEALHAADWFKDEAWIDPVAEDIARLLWKLGWRKQ